MVQALATKVGPISAASLPALMDRSKRARWRYRLLRITEYAGWAAALYVTGKGNLGPGTQKVAFFGMLANGVSGKGADSMKAQEALGQRAVDTVAKPETLTTIANRGRVARLAFGAYPGRRLEPFQVYWEP